MAFNLFKRKNSGKAFWKWFVENEERYYMMPQYDQEMFSEFSEQIQKVHPGLVFDFGPRNTDGKRELTISADGIRDVFESVSSLVHTAPLLDRWIFNAFRKPLDNDDVQIQFGDITIGYGDIYFRYQDDGGKLALELNIRGFQETSEFQNAIFILMDALIGEYDMETKIGYIEMISLDEGMVDELLPIISARALIDELRRAQLN